MSKFGVTTEKENQLLLRMQELGISEDDLVEKFVKGSGPGGQKINKTSSCVYLLHQQTGIEVKCQKTRSQALNRFHARRELCEKAAEVILGERSRKKQEEEKIRRQKRRRSRRAKEKMIEEKHKVGERKRQRKAVDASGD